MYLQFREAALALGMLEDDNSIHMCLAEAYQYQILRSLRRLFAMLLVFYYPTNTRVLWENFEVQMIEDFMSVLS